MPRPLTHPRGASAMPLPIVRLRRRLAPLAGLAAVLLLSACASAPRAPSLPASGDAVLHEMRARYDGKWYRTLTFGQRTTQAPAGGGAERRATWWEAMSIPGRLRIETDSTGRSGSLFARDSQFVVVNGTMRRGVPGHNVLLVLGFDVYAQPVERTAAILRDLGFPSGPVRQDTWEGRPVYVVGGKPGDLHSHQYWIDRERLVFVRLLQPWPGDTSQTYDVRFTKYRPLGGGWIAPEVEALVDGKRTLYEEYFDVRENPRLADGLFDPRAWTSASIPRR
jgi:hypothetical protein